MNTTETNDTEIVEMMQTLMNEGLQGFPAVMTRMYNLAMQFERELHLGAGKYERTDDRRGYANGYKPKTLNTHAGKLTLQIPQVRDSETPFYPRSLARLSTFASKTPAVAGVLLIGLHYTVDFAASGPKGQSLLT